MRFLWILLLVALAPAQAETVYKTVGPDGKIVYSDQPAAAGGKSSKLEFQNAPATPLSENVLRYQKELQKDLAASLNTAAGVSSTPRIFTLPTCGYCRKAKAYMNSHKIAYQEISVDTADGAKTLAQLNRKSRGVPVLEWQGRVTVGYTDGLYDSIFANYPAGH